ncbi:acyltransferase [Sphingomonas sp. PP-CC-3A-396]|uniref:acyltransferase family protein n=1 Tax=Sphingomonas sp. PP-CC-3A-396 TaxID=2135655 RepID=UPI001052499C|nr:acyltransferase [Sphingomonas sp. PP-CC-3A-396]TCQ03034.1 peptidoglycan/LPS O-acetylase OafA/YrhL [Sphingomonas sp. PP-CC-3A-396]
MSDGTQRTAATFSDAMTTFLDLARVVATNLVLFGHASQIFYPPQAITTGGIGVVIFFLLSGFLITLTTARRWERPGLQFRNFMIDRVARIFTPFIPVLIAVALTNVIVGIAPHPILGVNTGPFAFLGNMLLLHDYPVFQFLSHFGPVANVYPRAYNAAEPFWTIPIEFWTYAVFAFVAFVLVRREKPGLVSSGLLLIGLPVFIWNGFAGGAGNLSLLWILGSIGGILWLNMQLDRRARIRLGGAILGFGLLCAAGRIADAGFKSYDMHMNLLAAMIFFGMVMIVSAFERWPSLIARPIAFLASYSYSLYLVHNTVIIVFHERFQGISPEVRFVSGMIVAHVIAIVAYYLFERHYHAVGRYLKMRLPSTGASIPSTSVKPFG